MLTDELVKQIVDRIMEKAARRKEDAALGGHYHDGGYRESQKEIDFFLAGWERVLPSSWRQIAQEIRNEADEDWQEYQRLKKKFEG